MGRRGEDGKRITKKGKAQTSYDTYGKYNGKYVRRVEEQMVLPNVPVEKEGENGGDTEKKKSGKKGDKKK